MNNKTNNLELRLYNKTINCRTLTNEMRILSKQFKMVQIFYFFIFSSTAQQWKFLDFSTIARVCCQLIMASLIINEPRYEKTGF